MMDGISASRSGLNVSAQSLATSASNLSNLNTNGYKAQSLQQQALPQGGVQATSLQASQTPGVPGGSNVDPGTEAVNMLTQASGFGADLKALEVQQNLIGAALDMKA
jgi:flagellar basal body rod protein FlgG